MYPESDRLVAETDRWVWWADAHGIKYDEACTFDDIIPDWAGEAHLRLTAPDTEGMTSVPNQTANTAAYARPLLIEVTIERGGGDAAREEPARQHDARTTHGGYRP